MLFHYVPRKLKELARREDGSLILNEQNLKTLCLMEGLYEYPEMNSKLYLMYKSISKIENLGAYKNLKALYLQNNILKKIENLDVLPQLQSLFLHNNMLKVIENLDVPKLKILNLSGNQITKIQNLSHLSQLQSLSLSHNFLTNYDSVCHLQQCSPTLTNIDLSHNRLEGDHTMLPVFVNVKCLNLVDNPFIRELKYYRRSLVGHLPILMYLDNRAVDTEERMVAEAWVKEGEAGIHKVREDIKKHRQNIKQQRSQELMKDIDKHRSNKIMLFKSAIEDCKKQMKRLQQILKDSNCVNTEYFTKRMDQQRIKINDYYDMIIDIERRMGKVVTVKEMEYEIPLLMNEQNRESDHSTQPRHSASEADNQSSKESQEEMPPAYYDELD